MQIVDHLTRGDVPSGGSWACLGYRLHEFTFMLVHGDEAHVGPMYPTGADAYNGCVDHAGQQGITLLHLVGGRGDAVESACVGRSNA